MPRDQQAKENRKERNYTARPGKQKNGSGPGVRPGQAPPSAREIRIRRLVLKEDLAEGFL